MNRVRRAKLRYFVTLLILGAAAVGILIAAKGNWIVWVLLSLALLARGRIVAHYWRPLFRGNKCLNQGLYLEGIRHLTDFLEKIEERPWIKKLSWGGGMIYTQDVEAMALTNLGVAQINMGELDAAEARLKASLELDAENPFTHYNLGVLYKTQERTEAANAALERAVALGYSQDTVDALIRSAAKAYANLEGGRIGRGQEKGPRPEI